MTTRAPRPTYAELVALYASHPLVVAFAALSPEEREAKYPGMTAAAVAIKQAIYQSASQTTESKTA